MRNQSRILAKAYVACLAVIGPALMVCALSGCVCPTFHGRAHVEGRLASRVGHDLGPPTAPCDVVIPDFVDWRDGLDEDEAVAVGLWNNPDYQELLADLGITEADLIQAAQLQNPQITTLFPLGPKQWEFALNLPLDVIWLRPLRVAAAQLENERVAQRLTQDGLNVVRDIRLAYVDWQLAAQRVQLARQNAELRVELARIAEARLAAGAVAELDVSALRLDASASQAEVMRSERAFELARETLRYLLGLQLTELVIEPVPWAHPPNVDLDPTLLVAEAVSSRPDLRAVQLAVSAGEQRAQLARRDYWLLGGLLPDINSRGRKGFEAGPGVQFNLPIFHQNQGAIARAEADMERLRRRYVRLRDTAAWEVRQAHIQLLQAQQDLKIWREQVVPQAQEGVNSARKALLEDGVSLLLVLETTRQLLAALDRELTAEAVLRRALAELERSVGRRLLDAPAESARMKSREIETLPAPGADSQGKAHEHSDTHDRRWAGADPGGLRLQQQDSAKESGGQEDGAGPGGPSCRRADA